MTLLGQNVNSYGRDLTTVSDGSRRSRRERWRGHAWAHDPRRRARPLFADLLRAIGSVAGIRRVRFTSPHPKDLRTETIAAMAETEAVCEQLHLPLQSGSDRVLAAMRRGYTADRYLERLAAARAAIPDLAVTTDVIVGFPGETDEDFEQTLEVGRRGRLRRRLHLYLLAPSGDPGGLDDGGVRARGGDRRPLRPSEGGRRPFDAFPKPGRASGGSRRSSSRARRGKNPSLLPDRARESSSTSPPPARPWRARTYATVQVTSAGGHHLSGELVESAPAPVPARRGGSIPVSVATAPSPAIELGDRRSLRHPTETRHEHRSGRKLRRRERLHEASPRRRRQKGPQPRRGRAAHQRARRRGRRALRRRARPHDCRVQRAPGARRGAERPPRRGVRGRSRSRQAHDRPAPLRRPADGWDGAPLRLDRRDEDR